ncbi:hypothetical protein FHG87_023165, partial [Trinorchestia longiramus]
MGPKGPALPKQEFRETYSSNLSPHTSSGFSQSSFPSSQYMGSPSSGPSSCKITPLFLSSTSPSTTSSLSPSTPPSSSIASHGLPSSTTSSPSSASPQQPHASPTVASDHTESHFTGPPSPLRPQEWMGVREETMGVKEERLMVRDERFKPHLTITVPSNEDLRTVKMQRGCTQPSHWSKVKHAFLAPAAAGLTRAVSVECAEGGFSPSRKGGSATRHREDRNPRVDGAALEGGSSGGSLPPTPNTRTSFTFDGVVSDQLRVSGSPPELAPPSVVPRCLIAREFDPSPSPGSGGGGGGGSSPSMGDSSLVSMGGAVPGAAHTLLSAGGAVGRNLADLQKALSGEFSKKLLEWERLKGQQWLYGAPATGLTSPKGATPQITDALWGHQVLDGNLPHEFRKKLHEWEKIKEKEKLHGSSGPVSPTSPGHSPGTQHTPPADDTKTRRHEEGSLPPEFRKRLTEWEIGKVLAGKSRQNVEELQKNLGEEFNRKMAQWEKMKAGGLPEAPSALGDATLGVTGLDRKGSVHKVKKSKNKAEKNTTNKSEAWKNRSKEVLWLERELGKIEREKLRLEREKERYMEREARLESMWQAYRQGQAQKKEVFIKTSTGEFRFEGINQTFTKRLYEWEERRGIRPESSTIALLAPRPAEQDGVQVTRGEGLGDSSISGAPPHHGGVSIPKSTDLSRIQRLHLQTSGLSAIQRYVQSCLHEDCTCRLV